MLRNTDNDEKIFERRSSQSSISCQNKVFIRVNDHDPDINYFSDKRIMFDFHSWNLSEAHLRIRPGRFLFPFGNTCQALCFPKLNPQFCLMLVYCLFCKSMTTKDILTESALEPSNNLSYWRTCAKHMYIYSTSDRKSFLTLVAWSIF